MNYIDKIRQQYAIGERDSSEISKMIIQIYTFGIQPVENPCAVYIAGQPGSGKTTIQMNALAQLNNNSVLCDVDNFRDFFPYADDIKKNHEQIYGELTNEYAHKWNYDLREYCHNNNLNYIQETTLKDGKSMNELLGDVRQRGFRTEIQLLAVNPKLSLLSIYLRYEQAKKQKGAGRMVPVEFHNHCCESLPYSLRHIQASKLYDDLKIFVRNETIDQGAAPGVTMTSHNPPDIFDMYNREVSRPWSNELIENFTQRRDNIVKMMEARNAPIKEISTLRKLLSLPDEQNRSKGLYNFL